MRQIYLLVVKLLIFLLFLLSNGRIFDVHAFKADHYESSIDDSSNLLDDPKHFLSARQRCFSDQKQSSLLPNDNVFDSEVDDEEALTLRRHDLARCPANAVDTLSDLAQIDPAQTDLHALLNITDTKNRTTADVDYSTEPELNVQQLDGVKSQELNSNQATKTDQEADSSLTSNEDSSKPAVERPESPPPIATFEEWTKEKLMNKEKKPPQKDNQQNGATNQGPSIDQKSPPTNGQSNNGGNGANQEGSGNTRPTVLPSTNTQEQQIQSPPILTDPATPIVIPPPEIAKRNYASKECGAKVLLTNEEAEHKNAVLNDKERDEYMRNPCEKAQNKFLIIELCETIQPNFLEIANFELFSSGPREVRLSISERYPAVEWTQIGQFTAVDSRELQSFNFNSPGIYAKFIKLDLLSHYGKEHYCTLTTVRISGISMVDEYEEQASMDSVMSTISNQPDPPHATETVQQVESPEVVVPVKRPLENEQKVDPSNESDKSKPANKKFVFDKVADIVGNLGQIKEVIGKTFLGNRGDRKMDSRIWSNSCANFCPVNSDMNNQCPLKCHYFDLLDLPVKKQSKRRTVKTLPIITRQTHAQQQFLHSILKLAQCPTVITEPKRVEAVEQAKPTIIVETPKEKIDEVLVKVEQKAEEPKPNVQQNQQVPKAPPLNSLPGMVSTHKESVFMKLNKRLSALELNISLSSEYLSELSRRYVAQQDGYNKQHERDVRTLEEMVSRLGDSLKSVWSDEINQLRNDLKDLSEEITNIKQAVHHIPPQYEPADSSSLTLIDRSERPFHESCYNNMLPPAQDSETVDTPQTHDTTAWTNEQIVAVITLSNLSAFTLMACAYLLYKIFSRRSRIQSQNLSREEIRALVFKELDQIRQKNKLDDHADQVEDIHLMEPTQKQDHIDIDVYTSQKRTKRNKHRHPQKHGFQSVASSTLSIPSTVTTTSTSALDTMSSSPSLSDIDQMDTKPVIMDLINSTLGEPTERSASANLPLGVKTTKRLDLSFNSVQQQLSPPWQTVQNRRKLSDKSLKVPPARNGTKIKVN